MTSLNELLDAIEDEGIALILTKLAERQLENAKLAGDEQPELMGCFELLADKIQEAAEEAEALSHSPLFLEFVK